MKFKLRCAFSIMIAMFASVVSSPSMAEKPDAKVLIDIDWTLVYHINASTAHIEPEMVIEYEGKFLRLTDYAIEYIELFHRAGIDIGFLSGGLKARNVFLLNEIYKKVNAVSTAPRVVPRILSMNDLTRVAPDDSGLPFTERFKKDLSKYFSPEELQNVVLIDDDVRFAFGNQTAHFLNVLAFKDILNYRAYVESIGTDNFRGPHEPKNEIEYLVERNKFMIAGEAILNAVERRDQSVSFLQQLRRDFGAGPGEIMAILNERSIDYIRSDRSRMKAAGFKPIRRAGPRLPKGNFICSPLAS